MNQRIEVILVGGVKLCGSRWTTSNPWEREVFSNLRWFNAAFSAADGVGMRCGRNTESPPGLATARVRRP